MKKTGQTVLLKGNFMSFRACFSSFHVAISLFRRFALCYFIFSLFRVVFVRLFAWRFFVFSPRARYFEAKKGIFLRKATLSNVTTANQIA